jgi:outer membrane lipoprotein-sorting protein
MKFIFSIIIIFIKNCHAIELEELLNRVDRLYRSNTSTSQVQMEIKTPNWQRSINMNIWTKGMDYTFIILNSPRKDKGMATLKRQNDMWNFFPKINKVMKVPPSMMMSSWMGSDFTNDDLVKENTLRDDYKAILSNGENLKEYFITLTPKEKTVSIWGKIELYIDKKSLTPLRQIYYDEKNVKIRTMTFSDLQKKGQRLIPLTMTLTPHTKEKEGHTTIIKYLKINFNPKIEDSIFTRRNLQKRR